MTQWLIVILLVVISGCSTSNGGLNPDLTHSNEIVSAVGYASISEQSGRTQEEKVYGLCEHPS